MLPGDRVFSHIEGGVDPAYVTDAANRAATLLVRGARESSDPMIAERVIHLADTEGLDEIAEVWSHAAADSLAGCLWRLYALRQWVHASPRQAANEFDAGRSAAPFARVVAGVAEPPGPDELRRMIDDVLRGIATQDFADVLFRAAAFAKVIAHGRAALGAPDAARMLVTSEQLESAGHAELRHPL